MSTPGATLAEPAPDPSLPRQSVGADQPGTGGAVPPGDGAGDGTGGSDEPDRPHTTAVDRPEAAPQRPDLPPALLAPPPPSLPNPGIGGGA
jgi:hypothetical protein